MRAKHWPLMAPALQLAARRLSPRVRVATLQMLLLHVVGSAADLTETEEEEANEGTPVSPNGATSQAEELEVVTVDTLPEEALRGAANSVVASLITGYRPDASVPEREASAALCDALTQRVGMPLVQDCIWRLLVVDTEARAGAIALLMHQFDTHRGDRRELLPHCDAALVESLLSAVHDKDVLVRRAALDLLTTHVPCDSTLISEPSQTARLQCGILSAVCQRDASVRRRVFKWLLGATTASPPSSVLETPVPETSHTGTLRGWRLEVLVAAVKRFLREVSGHVLPIEVVVALLEKDELKDSTLFEQVLLPVLQYVCQHADTKHSEDWTDLLESTSDLLKMVPPSRVWELLCDSVTDLCDAIAKGETADETLAHRASVLIFALEFAVQHIPHTSQHEETPALVGGVLGTALRLCRAALEAASRVDSLRDTTHVLLQFVHRHMHAESEGESESSSRSSRESDEDVRTRQHLRRVTYLVGTSVSPVPYETTSAASDAFEFLESLELACLLTQFNAAELVHFLCPAESAFDFLCSRSLSEAAQRTALRFLVLLARLHTSLRQRLRETLFAALTHKAHAPSLRRIALMWDALCALSSRKENRLYFESERAFQLTKMFWLRIPVSATSTASAGKCSLLGTLLDSLSARAGSESVTQAVLELIDAADIEHDQSDEYSRFLLLWASRKETAHSEERNDFWRAGLLRMLDALKSPQALRKLRVRTWVREVLSQVQLHGADASASEFARMMAPVLFLLSQSMRCGDAARVHYFLSLLRSVLNVDASLCARCLSRARLLKDTLRLIVQVFVDVFDSDMSDVSVCKCRSAAVSLLCALVTTRHESKEVAQELADPLLACVRAALDRHDRVAQVELVSVLQSLLSTSELNGTAQLLHDTVFRGIVDNARAARGLTDADTSVALGALSQWRRLAVVCARCLTSELANFVFSVQNVLASELGEINSDRRHNAHVQNEAVQCALAESILIVTDVICRRANRVAVQHVEAPRKQRSLFGWLLPPESLPVESTAGSIGDSAHVETARDMLCNATPMVVDAVVTCIRAEAEPESANDSDDSEDNKVTRVACATLSLLLRVFPVNAARALLPYTQVVPTLYRHSTQSLELHNTLCRVIHEDTRENSCVDTVRALHMLTLILDQVPSVEQLDIERVTTALTPFVSNKVCVNETVDLFVLANCLRVCLNAAQHLPHTTDELRPVVCDVVLALCRLTKSRGSSSLCVDADLALPLFPESQQVSRVDHCEASRAVLATHISHVFRTFFSVQSDVSHLRTASDLVSRLLTLLVVAENVRVFADVCHYCASALRYARTCQNEEKSQQLRRFGERVLRLVRKPLVQAFGKAHKDIEHWSRIMAFIVDADLAAVHSSSDNLEKDTVLGDVLLRELTPKQSQRRRARGMRKLTLLLLSPSAPALLGRYASMVVERVLHAVSIVCAPDGDIDTRLGDPDTRSTLVASFLCARALCWRAKRHKQADSEVRAMWPALLASAFQLLSLPVEDEQVALSVCGVLDTLLLLDSQSAELFLGGFVGETGVLTRVKHDLPDTETARFAAAFEQAVQDQALGARRRLPDLNLVHRSLLGQLAALYVAI
ncbi:MAG: hypothetical protein MHM6MM_000663 [Cercozoa sp. M6MM]